MTFDEVVLIVTFDEVMLNVTFDLIQYSFIQTDALIDI